MCSYKFLTITKSKALVFPLSFHIAREHYVAARVCLQQTPLGLVYLGCLLSQQCVEMYVKAILQLVNKSEDIHYLPKLLKRGEQSVSYFGKLLTDTKLSYFIENLARVNSAMRFGEARFEVQTDELIQVLDEVAFNLDMSYREIMKAKEKLPIHVPDGMKEAFLCKNNYFGQSDISNDVMASMPLP